MRPRREQRFGLAAAHLGEQRRVARPFIAEASEQRLPAHRERTAGALHVDRVVRELTPQLRLDTSAPGGVGAQRRELLVGDRAQHCRHHA